MRYFLTWHSWLFIIATLLVIFLAGAIYPHVRKGKKRKEHWIISGLSGALFLLLVWSLIEPYIIVTKHVTVDLDAPAPFSVALISDIQTSPLKRVSFVDRVIDKILEEDVDAVLYAGDFINNETPLDKEVPHLSALTRLVKEVPMIAVYGNHEYGISNPALPPAHPDVHEKVAEEVRDLGITLLENEIITKMSDHGPPLFEIYGFDDLWNPNGATANIPSRSIEVRDQDGNTTNHVPRIALSHNPDAVFMVDKSVMDMVVSGHTHGGQIRLPFIGAFIKVSTALPTKFYKGLSRQNEIPLYVTSGLGESGPPMRLLNRPEIVILHIE